MPVIINDLEVILEERTDTGGETAADVSAPGADQQDTAVTPMTLERVDMHRRAQAARIRAH